MSGNAVVFVPEHVGEGFLQSTLQSTLTHRYRIGEYNWPIGHARLHEHLDELEQEEEEAEVTDKYT